MTQPLVSFNNLSLSFSSEQGRVRAVQGVSFDVMPGQTVGVVGESGCGKSVTAMSLMGLLPPQSARIDSGEILFEGSNLLTLRPSRMADLRGNQLAMIFQEPMSALNPVLTIGEQLVEPLIRHLGDKPKAAWVKATALLTEVGLARAESLMASYPHQLSGGMLQRVMIAMALSCKPKLLIADEPTTALDVTVQAQILTLLREQAQRQHMALMLITHDLGVIAQMADHVVVMYAGKIVEQGPTADVLRNPLHPYTQGLIASRPVPGERRRRLYSIPGQVPSLTALPPYCAFTERCAKATERCRQGIPPLVGDQRQAACFYSGLPASGLATASPLEVQP
jgi:peptide/nickel transport system ATP-binding protein